jgi:hypothetical protein
VIHQFQKWKGTSYVPKNVHTALQWHKGDLMNILPVVTDSPWKIVQESNYHDRNYRGPSNINFVPANGNCSCIIKVKNVKTQISIPNLLILKGRKYSQMFQVKNKVL